MKYTILFAIMLITTGCVTIPTPYWEAVHGSKADGTVTLQYQHGLIQAVASDAQGQHEAAVRCRAWGFMSAVAFSKTSTACTFKDDVLKSCMDKTITRTYQCVN